MELLIVHIAREFTYVVTALAILTGVSKALPRPWRRK